MSCRFPPSSRLLKKSEFLDLQARGRKVYSRHFVLLISPSAASRLGITITKKVAANAVDRNRLRRRIREIFRVNQTSIVSPIDLLVIARREATDCPFEMVKRELVGALRYHGYLNAAHA